MLKANANYQKLSAFRDAHPAVNVPGDGFFSNKTIEELQAIVDQTLVSLKKKREISGGNGALRLAAANLLKQAGSDDAANTVVVVWGIHQATAGAARGGGATTLYHFTVNDPAGLNDWHLYVDSGEKTIVEMSQGGGAFVQISNA